MRSNKKKIIGLSITFVLIAIGIGLIIFNSMNNKLRYNKDGDVGNTTGNLYNKGLFCEYEGYVYFSNAADANSLYRMKADHHSNNI